MADLMNYKTGERVRTATPVEAAESAAAALHDGGRGAILVTIKGEPTICYVEAEPALRVLGVLNSDWALELNDDDPDYFGGGELESQHLADVMTDQEGREVLQVKRGTGGTEHMVNLGDSPQDLRLRTTHIEDAFARTFERVELMDLKKGDAFTLTPGGAVWLFLGGLCGQLSGDVNVLVSIHHNTPVYKLV